MSIHLTRAVQYAARVEAFEDRGLSGQVACRAVEAGVLPITSNSIAERLRLSRIQEEIAIRKNGVPQPLQWYPSPLPALKDTSFGTKYEAPLLIVVMKKGGEELNNYGMYEASTGKMGEYAGKPSIEQLQIIASMKSDNFFDTVPAGNCNVGGYIAYMWAWRAIHAFFGVGGGAATGVMKVQISQEAGKACAPRAEVVVQDDKGMAVVQQEAYSGGGLVSDQDIRYVLSASGLVRRTPKVYNVTDAGRQGLLFPYFRGMLDSDPDGTFHIFQQHFGYAIAEDIEGTGDLLSLLRRGFRYLSNTEAGKILQHIFFGIDMAIRMGRELSFVEDGAIYAGFFLEGDMLILHRQVVISSRSAAQNKLELQKLNTHTGAVEKIHELLKGVAREDGSIEEVEVEALLNNPRMIRAMVQARRPQDIEPIRAELQKHIEALKFVQHYWDITADNLAKFLDYMVRGVSMIDEPMYVHMEVLSNRSSKILEYLSVFGGQEPSIYYGDTIRMIGKDGKDPNLAMVGTRRAVPHVPFIIKGIIAAGMDWASVSRQRAFKYAAFKGKSDQVKGFSDGKKRSGVVDGQAFNTFYSRLQIWVYSTVETKGAGKKRQLVDDQADTDEEGGAGPSVKKPKRAYL